MQINIIANTKKYRYIHIYPPQTHVCQCVSVYFLYT